MPASSASLISRDAIALLTGSMPNRSRTEAFVIGRRVTKRKHALAGDDIGDQAGAVVAEEGDLARGRNACRFQAIGTLT